MLPSRPQFLPLAGARGLHLSRENWLKNCKAGTPDPAALESDAESGDPALPPSGSTRFAGNAPPVAWLRLAWLLCLGVGFLAPGPALRVVGAPADSPAPAYDIKAAYLVRFLEYVSWPESAFAHAKAPIVIGVVGENPFGRFLDEIVLERNKQGTPDRPVVVRYWRTVDEIGACHALFAPDTEERRYARIASRVEQQPVLLVADEVKASLKTGFHVEFRQTSDKIRFAIDQSRAESCGLKLSARLLDSAIEVVRPMPPGNPPKPAALPPPPR